jgi:hypothetical protein
MSVLAALWGGIMQVFAVLRGLAAGVLRWAVVPLLAAIFLGGASTRAAAATPSVSVTGVGTASPVLRQVGPATWATTVLVTDADSSCVQATTAQYWLATRPYGVLSGAGVPGPTGTVAGTGPDGSACEVTVTFSKLAQVPTSAALVIDQSGASASVSLTVSRDVTLASYLGEPAIAGGIAVGLYVLLLLFVTIYDWQGGKHYLVDKAWWRHPVIGSGAWTAGDSWATNISTGLVVVGTFLAATTATNSLFPGVALDRFTIVNVVAGVFVVAAPVLFAILYAFFTNRDPGPSADSVVKVPPTEQVVLRVPSGATMTMVALTTVRGGLAPGPVNAGSSYQIAPGSVIAITPAAAEDSAAEDSAAEDSAAEDSTAEDSTAEDSTAEATAGVKIIAFSGTSDLGVLPGTTVHIGTERAYPVVAGDLPVSISATGGAKITVTGTADVNLPAHAIISGPRRADNLQSRTDRWLLLPQGSSVIVGRLGIMVAVNILTMFGIGAELGIAFVLAGFSSATGGWANGIYAGLAALAGLVLWYAISATRAMANPQPGSSLSAQAGTSFTL